jgi:hypothetical protein
LGRPYSILHHVTGRRADGMHCAEYVTDALTAGELIHVRRAPRVSPADLAEKVVQSGLYAPQETVVLLEPAPEPLKGRNWCTRLWSRSKRCTLQCCDQMTRWFCCK